MKLPLSDADAKWVNETLASLSTREKLGQVMIPRLTRHSVEPYGSVTKFIERLGVGGCHAFGGDPVATGEMIAEAHAASKVPLLISGDLERGAGQRVEGGTEFAGQLALGPARTRTWLTASARPSPSRAPPRDTTGPSGPWST